MICVIRRLALTVSDVYLKLGRFQSTSAYSALEVGYRTLCAVYIHDVLMYSLTSKTMAKSRDNARTQMSPLLYTCSYLTPNTLAKFQQGHAHWSRLNTGGL